MVDWPTLFGVVQEVANEKGATQAQHQSVASDLGEWWRNGGREKAKEWTKREARRWAERQVEI